MEGFPFVHQARVRLSDLDCRGHVNNAVFSSYIEDARLRWYVDTGEPDEAAPMTYAVDMVLARTEIDFRGEVRDVGVTLDVGVRVGRIGTKSLDLEYRVCAPGGRVVADARSVLVGFDYERGVSAPIPERWLSRLSGVPAQPPGSCDGIGLGGPSWQA
jgi:acyl-CoA thioester hydrolase